MNFTYIAKNKKTGKRISSLITAESVSSAVRNLNSQGLLPLTIKEAKNGKFFVNGNGKVVHRFLRRNSVKSAEISIFTRQLAATLAAGLLLSDALETVADDLENKYFQEVIEQIRNIILGGSSISDALARYPAIFSKSYISVVTTGETTGKLDQTLNSLAGFLENVEKIKQKVKSASQYPLFVFGFSLLVVVTMVLCVIPKFKEMFEQSGVPLPWLTQIVLGISDFFIAHIVWIFIIFLSWVIKLPKVSYEWDMMKLKLPIFGKEIIHKSIMSRFCRTLGFLLSSGVGLPISLEITSQVVNHQPIQNAIREIKKRIIAGSALSDAIKSTTHLFPRLVTKMSAVGEKTGRMDEMLNRTADYYDSELDHSIQGMMSLLEPTLIVFIGMVVGTVVIALYLPIFKMSSLIH